MPKPKLIVFASGTKDDGGSGFENLVRSSCGENPTLHAEIVAVVSNHENGGVHARVKKLAEEGILIPFHHFLGPFPKRDMPKEEREPLQQFVDDEALRMVKAYGAELVALSGWLKLVRSFNPRKTVNIHPGSLTQLGGRFGGTGMYGHNVHEAVKKALDQGEVTESAVTMHFVTPEYDRGPVFFEKRVSLTQRMTVDEIGERVNAVERQWQPKITNLVITGQISWDGTDSRSLRVPKGYKYLPKVA